MSIPGHFTEKDKRILISYYGVLLAEKGRNASKADLQKYADHLLLIIQSLEL